MRRLPEPRVWKSGVLLPDLLVQAGPNRALVCVVSSERQAARLARIARSTRLGESLVFVGETGAVTPLAAIGAPLIAAPACETGPLVEGIRQVLSAPSAAEATRRSA
jgi:hypothetical protein